MGKKHREEKEKLTGGWGSMQAVIWLLGLAVIAWQDWWWPGILVLVALSVVFEAVIKQVAPDAFVKETKPDNFSSPIQQPAERLVTKSEPAETYHRADLLPTNCPRCGAPTRGHDTHWTGPQSANCSYCGSSLPMKKI